MQFIQVYGNPLALLGRLLCARLLGRICRQKLLEIFQSFTSCWPTLGSHIIASTKHQATPICNIHHSSNDLAHGFLHSFPRGGYLGQACGRAPRRPASESVRTSRWVASPLLRCGTSWSMSRRIYGIVPRVPGNMFKKWGELKWCQSKDKYIMKENWSQILCRALDQQEHTHYDDGCEKKLGFPLLNVRRFSVGFSMKLQITSCVEASLGYQGPEMAKTSQWNLTLSHFGPFICSIGPQDSPSFGSQFLKKIHLDIYDRWDIPKKKRPKEINEQKHGKTPSSPKSLSKPGLQNKLSQGANVGSNIKMSKYMIWASFHFLRQVAHHCSKATTTDFWFFLVCQTQKTA